MEQVSTQRTFARISILAVIIVLLAVITALIHLNLAITAGFFSGHAGGAAGAGGFKGAGGAGGAGGFRGAGGAGGFRGTGGAGGFGGAGGAGGGQAPATAHGAGASSGLMGLVKSNMALLFALNFVGYIVLVIALYLPQLKRFQRIIRWALIVFTAITIIAYFAIVGLSDNTTGYIDKAAEIVLIVLLLLEDRKAARLARV
jgi:hypothetical protein